MLKKLSDATAWLSDVQRPNHFTIPELCAALPCRRTHTHSRLDPKSFDPITLDAVTRRLTRRRLMNCRSPLHVLYSICRVTIGYLQQQQQRLILLLWWLLLQMAVRLASKKMRRDSLPLTAEGALSWESSDRPNHCPKWNVRLYAKSTCTSDQIALAAAWPKDTRWLFSPALVSSHFMTYYYRRHFKFQIVPRNRFNLTRLFSLTTDDKMASGAGGNKCQEHLHCNRCK